MDQKVKDPIRFHFSSLKFVPYNSNSLTSKEILFKVITYLQTQKRDGQGYLIDRYLDRRNEGARELFMVSSVFVHSENRIRCNMAVVRPGRKPLLKPNDKFKLIPLTDIGDIVEQTHFFIDYSIHPAILCVEFNHHGPRIKDIEYYLRNISKDVLKLSKSLEMNIILDKSIDKIINELQDVLHFEIKVQPKKIAKLDAGIQGKYFTSMTNLGQRINPRYIRFEAGFQSPGISTKEKGQNKGAISMILDLVKSFKQKPDYIDCFDDFQVSYTDKNGNEDFFNLIRGKKEIIKEVEIDTLKKSTDWYELIKDDFDDLIRSMK